MFKRRSNLQCWHQLYLYVHAGLVILEQQGCLLVKKMGISLAVPVAVQEGRAGPKSEAQPAVVESLQVWPAVADLPERL